MWLYKSIRDCAASRQYSCLERRSLGVEAPFLLQFCIALFTGMVAATFVPPVRKSIPRAVEIGLWIALITVCAVGVVSVTDPNARNLSMSALWAADQIINTVAALLIGGVTGWISDHRYAIATWMILVAGIDIFALMLIRSVRGATPWQPRVRLREWMELPVPAPAVVPAPARVADPLAGVNRRLAATSAILAAAMMARSLDFSIRARDAVRVRRFHTAARAGAASSRARLESLRDAVAHFQFAARSWYAAAGQPAVNVVAERASVVATKSARAAKRGLQSGAALRPGQVIDIRALLNAPSIGWYGPLGVATAESTRGEDDATDTQHPDTLAS